MICVLARTIRVNMSKRFVILWLDYFIKMKFSNMMLALKWLNQTKELANSKNSVQKNKKNSKKLKNGSNFRRMRPKNAQLSQDTSMMLWLSLMIWRIITVSYYAKSLNQAFNNKVKTVRKTTMKMTILTNK